MLKFIYDMWTYILAYSNCCALVWLKNDNIFVWKWIIDLGCREIHDEAYMCKLMCLCVCVCNWSPYLNTTNLFTTSLKKQTSKSGIWNFSRLLLCELVLLLIWILWHVRVAYSKDISWLALTWWIISLF